MKAFYCKCKIVVLIQLCPSAITGTSSPQTWRLAFAKEAVKLRTVQRSKTWDTKCSFGAVPAAEQRLTRSLEKADQARPPLSALAVEEGQIPTSRDATGTTSP